MKRRGWRCGKGLPPVEEETLGVDGKVCFPLWWVGGRLPTRGPRKSRVERERSSFLFKVYDLKMEKISLRLKTVVVN